MNLRKQILTNNACYKAGKTITPKGIMVHSTGANNPWLKRYVAPDDGLLGKNQYATTGIRISLMAVRSASMPLSASWRMDQSQHTRLFRGTIAAGTAAVQAMIRTSASKSARMV